MPAIKTRKAQPPRTFRCVFHFGSDSYAVYPLPGAHPDVARRAYRLRKQTGDQEVYDVRLTEHGPECDCRGHVRWGHCKHVSMLVALGCLPAPPAALRMIAS